MLRVPATGRNKVNGLEYGARDNNTSCHVLCKHGVRTWTPTAAGMPMELPQRQDRLAAGGFLSAGRSPRYTARGAMCQVDTKNTKSTQDGFMQVAQTLVGVACLDSSVSTLIIRVSVGRIDALGMIRP